MPKWFKSGPNITRLLRNKLFENMISILFSNKVANRINLFTKTSILGVIIQYNPGFPVDS